MHFIVFQNVYALKTFKDGFYGEILETIKRLMSKGFPWECGGKTLSEVTFEETEKKEKTG